MILYFGIFLYIIVKTQGLDNGVALTPPMGFMTWQRFRCLINCELYPKECIRHVYLYIKELKCNIYHSSEELIKSMAQLMVTDGYLAAGYEYIIIDDCWSALHRDENDELQPDAKRFPSGISALSEYVIIGIYADLQR